MSIKDMDTSTQRTLNILKEGYENGKSLLYLFSSYIASNPDFKYNTTYLTDSIERFFEDYAFYKKKIEIYEEIIEYLNSENSENHQIEIVFDTKFSYNTKSSLRLEIIENNNSFDFHQIGTKQFSMKLILMRPMKIEYTYLIKTDRRDADQWKEKISDFMKVIKKHTNEDE